MRGQVVSRQRVCRHCGDLHEVGRWPDNCKESAWPRSDHPAPHIISDGLPGGVNGLFHHAALRKIDSKSAYRRATREYGCVEVGNDFDGATATRADVAMGKDVIEGAVNDALARHGVESDSDLGKINYER